MSTPNYPGGYPPYPDQPGGSSMNEPTVPGMYGQPTEGMPPSPSQPPVYGQPPMGQMPPTPPAKKSRKGLWITCGVIAAVVVVACAAGIGILAYVGAQAMQPITAAGTFCTDLKKQDYTAAYQMLSTQYQGQVTQEQFTQANQLHDQIDGPVTACGVPQTSTSSSLNFSMSSSNSASLDVQITRNKSYSGTITLVKQSGNWKIDKIDNSLQGTDLGPLVVGQTFCTALTAKNYQAAYDTLSAKYQREQGTEAEFAKSFNAPGATLSGCAPKLSTYSVSAGDDSATLDVAISVTVTTSSGSATVDVPATVSFVQEGGTWKISNIDVKTPS